MSYERAQPDSHSSQGFSDEDVALGTARANHQSASLVPSPPATSALDPPIQTSPSAQAHATAESTDLEEQTKSARKRSLPEVGDATPNHLNTSQQSARRNSPEKDLAGARRSSKRSLVGKRRAASLSSQKSARGGSTARASVEKPRNKGGVSRFLSILNCCSPPEDAKPVDNEEPEASKEISNVRPSQSTQNTPASRFEAAQSESPDDSKERLEDTSSAAKKSLLNEKDIPNTPHPIDKDGEKAVLASENKDSGAGNLDKPLPASPAAADASADPNQDQSRLQQPVNGASNQTPISASGDAADVPLTTGVTPAGEAAINDRTLKQVALDEDIEMTDAPPSIPLTNAEAVTTREEVIIPESSTATNTQPQVNLPPPPPPTSPPVAPAATETQVSSEEPAKDDGRTWLLPPVRPEHKGKKCLVLDLDETLVHSSFKILHQADFTIPVEIEGAYHNVYVIKRPGVDQFMKRVGELYEVVVFTASVSKYGDPLLDQLDIHNVVHHRLFRESCYNHQGNYVKVRHYRVISPGPYTDRLQDLSQVGRDLKDTIIIDNSPTSYIFHPQHAVPISSWFSDAHDNELLDLIPVLEDLAGDAVRDVSLVLDVGL